ncbi:MAG: hypothetical protein LBH41_02805 [Rickettsiales bacterium]|nr:hypothetical protein [Rickettsiales bacterium]
MKKSLPRSPIVPMVSPDYGGHDSSMRKSLPKSFVVPIVSPDYDGYNSAVISVAEMYDYVFGGGLTAPLSIEKSKLGDLAYMSARLHEHRAAHGYGQGDGVRFVLPSYIGLLFSNMMGGDMPGDFTVISDVFIPVPVPNGSTVIAPRSELGLFQRHNIGRRLDLVESDIASAPPSKDVYVRIDGFAAANREIADAVVKTGAPKVAFVGGRARDEYGRYAEMTPDIMKKAAADIMKWAKGQSLLVVTNDKHGFVDDRGTFLEPYQAFEQELFARQELGQVLQVFGRDEGAGPVFANRMVAVDGTGKILAHECRVPVARDSDGDIVGSPYHFAMFEAVNRAHLKHNRVNLMFTADNVAARAELGAFAEELGGPASEAEIISRCNLDYLPWKLSGGSQSMARAHINIWKDIKKKAAKGICPSSAAEAVGVRLFNRFLADDSEAGRAWLDEIMRAVRSARLLSSRPHMR